MGRRQVLGRSRWDLQLPTSLPRSSQSDPRPRRDAGLPPPRKILRLYIKSGEQWFGLTISTDDLTKLPSGLQKLYIVGHVWSGCGFDLSTLPAEIQEFSADRCEMSGQLNLAAPHNFSLTGRRLTYLSLSYNRFEQVKGWRSLPLQLVYIDLRDPMTQQDQFMRKIPLGKERQAWRDFERMYTLVY